MKKKEGAVRCCLGIRTHTVDPHRGDSGSTVKEGGARWKKTGPPAAKEWPKRSVRMEYIDCGGPSDDRAIKPMLGLSPTGMRAVKRGGEVRRSPDITPGRVILHPFFGRSAAVHLAPTDKLAGSAKEQCNRMVGVGGDGGRGKAGRRSRRRGRGQGRGQDGRGARILNLREQKTLEILGVAFHDPDKA